MSPLACTPPCPVALPPVPDCVHNAVGAIVQRAKVDRAGAYWQLGATYRAAGSEILADSLGYGAAGVLLVLLGYYRRTGDQDTADLLHKGVARIQTRARGAAFRPGFYGGTAGLWYLYRQLDCHLPGLTGDWRAPAGDELRRASQDSSASLGLGAAGAIVGALACLELPGDQLSATLQPLVDRVLAFSGVGETGLFWDCNVTSIRPPLGFLFGNAGIDYALAYAGASLQRRFTPVLLGSLARAQSLFDAQKSNWPDFDTATALRDADQAAVDRILDRVDGGEPISNAPEVSVTWASGAAGILLGRSALVAAFPDSDVATMATADVARAVQALERTSDAELEAMDASLQNGLAGVALAGRAAAGRLPSQREVLTRCADRVEAVLSRREPMVLNGDVGLLSGVAGQAYALLARDLEGETCVDPLAAYPLRPVAASAPDMDARAALTWRLPTCARLLPGRAFADRPITLGALREQVVGIASGSGDVDTARRRCEHELSVQHVLSQTNFRGRFWAELAAQRRFTRDFGETMDDNVLFGRFAIDPSVTILDSDFDPATGAVLPAGQELKILRQPGSKGVIEARLTPLQAALLHEFDGGAVSLAVIQTVIDRVQTPNVTQRQLATLALKMIRGFIQGGQLTPVGVNAFAGWLSRRKYRDARKNLFPAGAA